MIEVKDLVKRYGQRTAVDHLNFSLDKGKIYGFLGPNGAGKSTTMNVMTGYLAPTEGTVEIDGYDIVKEPEKAKREIGYLPEIPPLYPEMTVLEYLSFACDIKGLQHEKKEKQIKAVTDLTKTGEVQERLIKNLSKGYKQRVGFAQAMLGFPEILILDEPTVGLDPAQIIEVRELIRRLAKNHTVILSSHILAEVREVCDYILIINRGRLVAGDTYANLEAALAGGEAYEIEAKADKATAKVVLERVAHIGKLTFEKPRAGAPAAPVTKISFHAKDGVDPREAVFRAFAEADVPLLTLKQNQASLEEVFLKLTGGEEVRGLESRL